MNYSKLTIKDVENMILELNDLREYKSKNEKLKKHTLKQQSGINPKDFSCNAYKAYQIAFIDHLLFMCEAENCRVMSNPLYGSFKADESGILDRFQAMRDLTALIYDLAIDNNILDDGEKCNGNYFSIKPRVEFFTLPNYWSDEIVNRVKNNR